MNFFKKFSPHRIAFCLDVQTGIVIIAVLDLIRAIYFCLAKWEIIDLALYLVVTTDYLPSALYTIDLLAAVLLFIGVALPPDNRSV